MKKLFLFSIIILSVLSCSTDNAQIKKALKASIVDQSEGLYKDNHYKLKSFTVLDTLTNQELMDSLSILIIDNGLKWPEPTMESLLKTKETEFPYIDKENSKELAKYRHKIDSLINNWENVTEYSFELNFYSYLFKYLECIIYDVDPIEDWEEKLSWMEENMNIYQTADSIYKQNKDEIYAYKILHNYSIYNPVFKKRLNVSRIVLLDKELHYMSSETTNGIDDMIEQLFE